MIEPSPTARRTEPLAHSVGAAQGEQLKMAQRYEQTRKEKPRCTSCNAKTSYDKVADPYRLCEPCSRKRTDRIMAGVEQAPFDPERLMPPKKSVRIPELRRIRKERGWKLRGPSGLLEHSGASRSVVERAENGHPVSENTARKVAAALGVSLAELKGSA